MESGISPAVTPPGVTHTHTPPRSAGGPGGRTPPQPPPAYEAPPPCWVSPGAETPGPGGSRLGGHQLPPGTGSLLPAQASVRGNRCWGAAPITTCFFLSFPLSPTISQLFGKLIYMYVSSIYILPPAVPLLLPSGGSGAVSRCSPKSSSYRELEAVTTPSGETRAPAPSPPMCWHPPSPAPFPQQPCTAVPPGSDRPWGGFQPVPVASPPCHLGGRRCCALCQPFPGGRAGWKFPI